MNVPDMRCDAQMISSGEEWAMPWDLREWFEAERLQGWLREEIETLDWANPELVEHLRHRQGYDPKAFLLLLTYAYITASFESDEIQRRSLDADFRRFLGRPWAVGAREITRFRRENRGLLKWALIQLFKRALRARHGEFLLPAGLKHQLVRAAVTRLDLARQMDRGHEGL